MRIVLRILFVFLLITASLSAKNDLTLSTTGKIAGRITDTNTGEPIPFVTVMVVGSSLGSASDIDGYYSIINVQPGTYSVKASAIGYSPVTIQNVKVSIDQTTKVDIKMTDASIQGQEVVVTASRPLIQKDVTSTTSVVGDQMISELPITEISDVLQLQAGIVVSPGGDIHVRGGRSGQVTYQIDGVPITDSYDGSNIMDVNSSAVKELQVISGAFNAEYGQALSGVINLVTKDGGNKIRGSLQMYSGSYVSTRENIFWNIKKINPVAIHNFEGSLSGPIFPDKLFFFTNIRYYNNAGYLFGKREFLVTDNAAEVPNSGGSEFTIKQSGDGAYVSLNPSARYYGQGKLSYNLLPELRVGYNYMIDRQNYKIYDNYGIRLTPDNNLDRFEKSYSNIFSINHVISPKSFYTLNLSYYFKDYRHWLFEDIYTSNPVQPTLYIDNTISQTPPYSYNVGGTNYNRFTRNSGTYSAKLDWSTQFTQEINIQFGGEFKRHQIYFQNINLVPMVDANGLRVTPFNVVIPPKSTTNYDEYLKNPTEASGYVQAKFEAFSLIFNIGVRYDLFSPDGVVLADPSDPNILNPLKPSNKFNDSNGNGVLDQGESVKSVQDREKYWYTDAKTKSQFSPRIGLAFPITEKGVLHFSYGHFFQLPRYEYLYTNPEFELGVGSGNQGLFGNADLNPQKTVKGEIGIQQQIGDDIAVDVTMFFEDFRNLTGTQSEEIVVFGGAATYSRFANSDFGFSKGVIAKFSKRFSEGLAANIDYTYSVTKGNSSNPADARNSLLGGALPETYITPLNWDQTHTLNISLAYSKPGDFGFSIIGNLFSGQPYTPAVNKNTRVTQNAFPRNSDSKPTIFNVDLRLYKDLMIGETTLSFFLKVFNLLDFDNAVNIYSDTGDPYFTFPKYDAERINPRLYYNSLNDLYTNPTFFSEPRRVEVGVSYNF
ncbi:MAG: TonB-dependent receptor [Melioribacteraceae bacterium]